MICGYWGIHTFIRREVFHLLVWCSTWKSWLVCFLSMERRCVPRRSSRAINQSLTLQAEPNAELEYCAVFSDLLLQQMHFISFKICRSKTVIQCVRRSKRKYTVTQKHFTNPHASHFASSKLSAACGYEDWQLGPRVRSQRASEPAVEITLTVRGAVLISGYYSLESAAGCESTLTEQMISSDTVELSWQLSLHTG